MKTISFIRNNVLRNKKLLVIVFSCSAICGNTSAQQFRAAVVKKDITPSDAQWLAGFSPRKSTGIHDRIYHRIIALDDGKSQFFLISSDLVNIPMPVYNRTVALLQRKYNISPLNIWWSATHNHSAPVVGPQFKGIPYASMAGRRKLSEQHEIDTVYTAMLEQKLIEGVVEARSKLAPARLGAGWGFSQANINRRAIDENGKASLGLNPDGPVDRRIGLLRIDKEDGTPLALIANYAMHGTVLGMHGSDLTTASLVISGDAPGVVAEYVEQKIGAPMLYVNGAAGNLAPIYSVYSDPKSGHLDQFRVLLGDRILEASKKITPAAGAVKLSVGALTVETPRRPGLEWSPDLGRYTKTTKAGVNMIRLPVHFLKINEEIAIWSAPVELFCEVSNEVRDRSPFPYTFYFGYTNGSLNYLPTEAAWKEGGYEPSVSPFTPAAAKELTESVTGYLLGEFRGVH
ncbi:MAG: neutral/alkaline non-lysosomal ceramidase N-terminal domain-containing protein [Chitinophagaceae bacterium]|nr:neutral/alkaline non-lysosomal ceramidase N-terminal domain-containing protein [Chitinophagaceae bacterium]